MKSKKLIWFTFPLILLAGLYFLGPQPDRPKYDPTLPSVPAQPEQTDLYVERENSKHKIKPANEAEVIWADSTRKKTEYVVLYLHGFSASKMEGDPVHKDFARNFNCNLFLARLSDHGVDTTETLMLFTVDRIWNSAKQALAIAKTLGEKVIVMGTSTGSTLGLKLAATYPDDVFALINLSPNIEINNGAAFLLNDPWGLYIARMVMGGKNRITDATEEHAQYWNKKYRLEAVTQLQELLETSMTSQTFSKIKQPSLTLYYFKNDQEQDPEVRVDAMLRMNDQLATPIELKKTLALPDAGAHVIGCALTSGDVQGVYTAIENFAIEILGMKKVN